ncbi:MAG: hypothetical protein QMC96_12535 [Methanomicrobiales archaeon]|nr:hypothetical protein [Methanomicrobiales archaeon]
MVELFLELVIGLIVSVLIAAAYAVLGYLRTPGQELDGVKFMATLILGAILGALFWYIGIAVTLETLVEYLVSYGFLLIIIENALKAGIRRSKKLSAFFEFLGEVLRGAPSPG